jgi:type I restriction-modification system DNA methylase subunit
VVQLIAIDKPEPKQKIYDPTCSGGMLIESLVTLLNNPTEK